MIMWCFYNKIGVGLALLEEARPQMKEPYSHRYQTRTSLP